MPIWQLKRSPEGLGGGAGGQRDLFDLEIRFGRLTTGWVRLGSFWLWVAFLGEKLGSFWVRLGSFGFVFIGLKDGFICITLCANWGCVDLGVERIWVCFARFLVNGER